MCDVVVGVGVALDLGVCSKRKMHPHLRRDMSARWLAGFRSLGFHSLEMLGQSVSIQL